MTWKEYQAERAAQEREEAAARSERQAAYEEYIAALKARKAELERKIDRIKARQPAKILYLPKGRVRHADYPSMDFVVDERTAAELNIHAAAISDWGGQPFLDLEHRAGTRTFDLSKFTFEPDGVFAHGRYTPLGWQLHNAGRISGVSATTFVVASNNDPAKLACAIECEISEYDARRAPKAPMTLENQACMGGVLIDGSRSAIQPYRTWKRTLNSSNLSDEAQS